MEDLLLSRQNLDEMENNPIFTLWLYGSVEIGRAHVWTPVT